MQVAVQRLLWSRIVALQCTLDVAIDSQVAFMLVANPQHAMLHMLQDPGCQIIDGELGDNGD
jgi:hypothetical protein